jgi:hypothetical protein
MATMLRALVMLGVFVGLPAAWIYYGPLPAEAQRLVDRVVTVAKEAVNWEAAPSDALPQSPNWVNSSAAPQYTPAISAATEAPAYGTPPSGNPSSATDVEAAPPAAPTIAARLEPLLVQLRQWNVAAYDLRPWGGGEKLYRFHCEMPLGANAGLTQQFEAVAADPQTSVEQVVAQVSQWRLERGAGGM